MLMMTVIDLFSDEVTWLNETCEKRGDERGVNGISDVEVSQPHLTV